jgi:hypothetical protein
MTYSVVWSVTAALQLSRVEGAADDAAAVRAAANRIDYALRRTPHDVGESRDPGYRLWYEGVLGVWYRIKGAEMRVDVLSVGPARRR